MKSFVIVLENHQTSEDLGKIALESGKKYHWDVRKFKAIDGRTTSLEEHGLFPVRTKGKCREAFSRPGVIGCFLSHYSLWKYCLESNEIIGIFEQDIEFRKPNLNDIKFVDVLRLDKPSETGRNYGTGVWWEGAHAYFVTPQGAKKLINWTHNYGAYPADVMLGTDVVDIQFNLDSLIFLNMESRKYSLTARKNF